MISSIVTAIERLAPEEEVSRRSFMGLLAWAPIVFMSDFEMVFGQKASTPRDRVEVVHTRVFAVGPTGGNPCPVIPSAGNLTDSQMQAVAQRFGLDTAFILRTGSRDADIRLRYFVPDHEMGVSGHATIAAITVAQLDQTLKSNHVRVATITGKFGVDFVRRSNNVTVVTLEQNRPVFGAVVAPDDVARALKINPEQIVIDNGPVQSVSVSRAKLLVPLKDSLVLDGLKPDYEALWKLCDRFGVSGFYPFTRRTGKPQTHAEARQFPLRAGFPEDAATGVAAAALAAYLAAYDSKYQTGQHLFRIAQGYAMGAPSLIEAIAECEDGKITRTAIRGTARITSREQVSI